MDQLLGAGQLASPSGSVVVAALTLPAPTAIVPATTPVAEPINVKVSGALAEATMVNSSAGTKVAARAENSYDTQR